MDKKKGTRGQKKQEKWYREHDITKKEYARIKGKKRNEKHLNRKFNNQEKRIVNKIERRIKRKLEKKTKK